MGKGQRRRACSSDSVRVQGRVGVGLEARVGDGVEVRVRVTGRAGARVSGLLVRVRRAEETG